MMLDLRRAVHLRASQIREKRFLVLVEAAPHPRQLASNLGLKLLIVTTIISQMKMMKDLTRNLLVVGSALDPISVL
jgi:hypothetical protein